MSNDEIVAALRYCQITEHSDCWGCPANIGDSSCLDVLHKDAADALESQQKRIEELEAGHRWIPVTERLPEDLCPVLVSLKGLKKAFVGRYQDSEWWSEGASSRPFMLEVTHWMPQPSPPKEV